MLPLTKKRVAPFLIAAFVAVAFVARADDVPGVKRGPWVGKALDAPGGRSPFASDPILVKFLKDGDLATPADAQDGWARLAEDGNEVRPQFGNGYAAATIESDAERVVLVRASGNAWAAVNGSPLAGDIYRAGAPPLPVALSKGANHVLVRLARGGFSFAIEPAPTGIAIDGADATLPDIRAGVALDSWGQVVLVNASANPLQGVQLEVAGSGFAKTSTAVPPIPPLTAVKARFAIKTESSITGAASAALTVKAIAEGSSASRDFSLRVRSPGESWKETFV